MSARVSTPPMAHHLAAGACALARGDRAFERLQPVLGDHILGHAHLRAQHHIGVLCNRAGRDIGLRKVDVIELGNREARQSDVGYVHEGIDSRARRPAMKRRNAAKLLAPASPADTQVVVH